MMVRIRAFALLTASVFSIGLSCFGPSGCAKGREARLDGVAHGAGHAEQPHLQAVAERAQAGGVLV